MTPHISGSCCLKRGLRSYISTDIHSHEQLHHRQPQRHRNDLNRIERWVGAPCFDPAQICAKETTAFGKNFLRVPLLQPELAYTGSKFDGERNRFHALECAVCALIHTHTNSYILLCLLQNVSIGQGSQGYSVAIQRPPFGFARVGVNHAS